MTTNSYPGKVYARPRKSSFISKSAVPPKSVETHAERVTLVYQIRIDIDNPSHELVPGLPAGRKDTRPGAWQVMSAAPAIEARNLIEPIRGAAVVERWSVSICAPGEVFGFVGPDGAGKTTIMRLLAAVMTPDEGSIAIEGL